MRMFVEKYDLFSIFPTSLKEFLELRKYEKNEFIFFQGYFLNGFYYHLEGTVKILHMLADENESILRFSSEPRIYGGAEKNRAAAYILSLKSKNETLRELKEVPLFLGIGHRHFLRLLSGFVDMGVLKKMKKDFLSFLRLLLLYLSVT